MLKRLAQSWMRAANAIGNFNSRVVLTLFYALVVLPFGLVVRLFGDPLAIRTARTSAWTERNEKARSIEDARRQHS
jgi:hypothetical protein